MNPISGIITYVRSSKAELEKVSWPSRQDTIRYATLVVVVSIVVAAFFATLDFGLNKAVEAVLLRRAPAEENHMPVNASNINVQPIVTPDLEATPADVKAVTPSGAAADITVEPLSPGTVTTPDNTKK